MNNKSLLDKFKSLTRTKPTERDLFKSKKAELKKDKILKPESLNKKYECVSCKLVFDATKSLL
jgi:hypothetical protein